MWKQVRRFAPLLTIPIVILAIALIYRELKHYNLHDVARSLRHFTPLRLATVLVLVAINYIVLIAYDWLAVRYLKLEVPLRRVALAAFVAYVTSYNFGVLLGGTSIRYRFYSRWGLPLVDIARLVAVITLTCWLGLFALSGIVFLFEPLEIPGRFGLYVTNIHVLGLLLLAAVGAYFGFGATKWMPPMLRRRQFEIPPARITLAQIAIAGSDWALAACVLFVLLKPWITVGYPMVLGIYLLAMVTSYLSHVPGGVGVFELVVMTLLPDSDTAQILSALLVFRFLYLLLPLSVGLGMMVWYELITLKRVEPPI